MFSGKLKDNYGGAVRNETEISVSFKNDGLKLLFICYDRDIISKGRSYNDKLYEGDTVELFLTLGDKNRYLELEVNPDGITYACVVENDGSDLKMNYLSVAPFFATTKRKSFGWTSEWEIPLVSLYPLGFRRDNAYFNIYRQDFQGQDLCLYALNPTMKSTFHDVESFIKLKI